MHWSLGCHGRIYDSGDPLVIYFDPASGETYLISEVAAFLLEMLKEGPRSTRALADLLQERAEHGADESLEGTVDALLQDLESFDLVEKTECAN